MAINFPASPTLNQTFSSGNVNYVWDGTKWTASVTGGISLDKIEKGNTKAEVVDTGSDGRFVVTTEGSERLRVDSSGRVGIGNTTAGSYNVGFNQLVVGSGGDQGVTIVSGTSSSGTLAFADGTSGADAYRGYVQYQHGSTNALVFATDGSERFRCDSSGRLLVGTSSARTDLTSQLGTATNGLLQVEAISNSAANNGLQIIGNSAAGWGGLINLAHNGGSQGTNTLSGDNTIGGAINFLGNDGNGFHTAATIECRFDGAPANNSMPGKLSFYTTASGASSPTERMRITSDGGVFIGKTTGGGQGNVLGIDLGTVQGVGLFVRSGGELLYLNRKTNDGTLVRFVQDDTDEGSISVSGTTVSYNGAHLSRWSQLPSGADRTEILRGSLLSNLEEMCEWGDEDNEQLNRMKVSDVEGDKNVAGVFQAWDDDDDTYTNDFYCAMTGDFIIRIGAGVTVERGDLLMSAGDGTAKPQDDDIIRSKTIAKVTSTNVSCTYDDGSYCVPCVLMAC